MTCNSALTAVGAQRTKHAVICFFRLLPADKQFLRWDLRSVDFEVVYLEFYGVMALR